MPIVPRTDIVVIGAGPSGLHLSYRLSSAGISVTVFEMRRRVGWQTCSGLLSAETVRRYHLRDVAKWRIDGADIRVGSTGFTVRRRGVAYVFDRSDLDDLLLERAVSAGAQVLFSRRISLAELKGLLAKSRYVVGAAGSGDPLRLMLGGAPRVLTGAIALVPSELSEDRSVSIYLDDRAPLFFSWVIPRGDLLELGTAVDPRRSWEIPRILRSLAGDIGAPPPARIQYRPIVVDAPLHRVVYGNVALLGDAASQVKATTGGGISFGLRAADLLADALISGDLSAYQRRYLRSLYPELLAHYILRRVLDRLGPSGLEHAIDGLETQLSEVLSQSGEMDSALSLLKGRILPVTSRIASRALRTLLGLP